MMLNKNVYGAPIADAITSSSHDIVIPTKKAANRYIGFLSLSTMVLWCLEEMEKSGCFDGEGRDSSDEIVGNLRSFTNIRTTPMSEFIQLDSTHEGDANTEEKNPGGFMSAGDLRLRNNFLPTMASPVTHEMNHTLKQAMKAMVETRTASFFIDTGSRQLARALTLRSIIMEFAPPGVDTRLGRGGFFETALEQTGCHCERGTLFRHH